MMNPQVIGMLLGVGVVTIVLIFLKCYLSCVDNNNYGTIQAKSDILLL